MHTRRQRIDCTCKPAAGSKYKSRSTNPKPYNTCMGVIPACGVCPVSSCQAMTPKLKTCDLEVTPSCLPSCQSCTIASQLPTFV